MIWASAVRAGAGSESPGTRAQTTRRRAGTTGVGVEDLADGLPPRPGLAIGKRLLHRRTAPGGCGPPKGRVARWTPSRAARTAIARRGPRADRSRGGTLGRVCRDARVGRHGTPKRGTPAGRGPGSAGQSRRPRAVRRDADFVVIAIPHTPATTGLINAQVLAAMRPSGLPDQRRAADRSWTSGRCMVRSPTAGSPARRSTSGTTTPNGADRSCRRRAPSQALPNVILTPHTAGYTEGTMRHRYTAIAENIRRLVAGEPLENVVWPRA